MDFPLGKYVYPFSQGISLPIVDQRYNNSITTSPSMNSSLGAKASYPYDAIINTILDSVELSDLGFPITSSATNDALHYGYQTDRYYRTRSVFSMSNWSHYIDSYYQNGSGPQTVQIGWINGVHPNGWRFSYHNSVVELKVGSTIAIAVLMRREGTNNYALFVCPTTGSYTTTTAVEFSYGSHPFTNEVTMFNDKKYFYEIDFALGSNTYRWSGSGNNFADMGTRPYSFETGVGLGINTQRLVAHIMQDETPMAAGIFGSGPTKVSDLWYIYPDEIVEQDTSYENEYYLLKYNVNTYDHSTQIPLINKSKKWLNDLGVYLPNYYFEVVGVNNPNFLTIATDEGIVFEEVNGEYYSKYTIDDYAYDKCDYMQAIIENSWLGFYTPHTKKIWYVNGEVYRLTPNVEEPRDSPQNNPDIHYNYILWQQVPVGGTMTCGPHSESASKYSGKYGTP